MLGDVTLILALAFLLVFVPCWLLFGSHPRHPRPSRRFRRDRLSLRETLRQAGDVHPRPRSRTRHKDRR